MAVHLMRETDKLKKMVLSLAAHVEENVRAAVRSVIERDQALAYRTIETDHLIDIAEVDVEEECLKILALHQPVAHDLRYIVAMLKINRDLERIGDLAVSMAERAIQMIAKPKPKTTFDLGAMCELCEKQVSHSLDAMINRDANLAREIWLSEDDRIDTMMAEAFQKVETEIREHPENTEPLMNILSVARSLERIADHATNIAKDTIYMVEGEIVRHRKRKYREQMAAAQQNASPG
ncbi:MAG TPA: phosphate signaling complex protein PhoU [Kiritimatiellia bacterium]|nr:phosphate signaling complex protein PhoU [Kiritimatiellia bacterium]HMO97671.1 phosphate signaling complex protein PhoU [Kiritimatiellia bacterium]HMP95532.1 phosphate signaling complex protein PhoU [Kiritimatiellia bacterium]